MAKVWGQDSSEHASSNKGPDAAAENPCDIFEFGLQRLLDGIEAFVDSRTEPHDQK